MARESSALAPRCNLPARSEKRDSWMDGFQELLGIKRVQYVLTSKPATARHIDAVREILQILGGMSVTGDHELDAPFTRRADPLWCQIEPPRIAVDFYCCP